MAITSTAYTALLQYCAEAKALSSPHRATIRGAVVLTGSQQQRIAQVLSALWDKAMPCPFLLDLKPQHGYQSRVHKDGFGGEQYAEWLAVGCADVAAVGTDKRGRPHLIVNGINDGRGTIYDIMVPVRSTTEGVVYIDDVIPLGLPAKKRA